MTLIPPGCYAKDVNFPVYQSHKENSIMKDRTSTSINKSTAQNQRVNMKKTFLILTLATVILMFAVSCTVQQTSKPSQSAEPFPIIDMHDCATSFL